MLGSLSERARAGKARLRLPCHRPQHQLLDREGDSRLPAAGCRGRAIEHPRERLGRVAARVGRVTGERVIEDGPCAVDVGASVGRGGLSDLLGRHIERRPERDPRAGDGCVVVHASYTEVEELDPDRPGFTIEEHVRRLQIPMHDPSGVGVTQGPSQLHRDGEHLGRR